MITNTRLLSRRLLAGAALALALLCTGCLEKRIVWSPDGSRAIVTTKQRELYLCDASGQLTGKLADGVELAVWLGGPQRIALARKREVKEWAAAAAVVREEGTRIAAAAEKLRQKLGEGGDFGVALSSLSLGGSRTDNLVKLCLRDRFGAEVRPRLSAEQWRELEGISIGVTDLMTAQVDGDRLTPGPVMHTSIYDVLDIRPSPVGDVIAWTQETKANEIAELFVVLASAPGQAVRVATGAAAYPDWYADGRSLVYVEAPVQGTSEDTLALGALARRTVLDEHGKIAVEGKPKYLAGMVFNVLTHVRCLRDGRILFNAAELALPVATGDGGQRDQLFAVDPDRQPTLVRHILRSHETDLPQSLSFFEVSPDETKVLFGGMKSEVALLTLATGEARSIQDADDNSFQGLPVWRTADEFSYAKRIKPKDGEKPTRPAEIVLRRADKETVLSAKWPSELVADVASEDRK